MRPVHPTFCGVPSVTENDLESADVVVYSASDCSPYAEGADSHSQHAAGAIRGVLDAEDADRSRWDFDVGGPFLGQSRIADFGAVLTDPLQPADNREAIELRTRHVVRAGAMPVLLGGDDSVPIPFLAGLAERGRPLTVLQIDAHIDWREERYGNRFGYSSTMRRASEMAHIGGIVQVGIRGVGSASADEVQTATTWGAKILTMAELHAEGLGLAIDAIPSGSDVVVCLDVDALDPSVVPGVLSPTYGGLTYREMLALFRGVAAKSNIAAASIVEFVPERDPTGEGAKAVSRLICCLIALATKGKVSEPSQPQYPHSTDRPVRW